jgi:hypothetical protein
MTMTGESETSLRERFVEYPRRHRSTPSLVGEPTGLFFQHVHGYARRSGYLHLRTEAKASGTTARTHSSFGYLWNAFDAIHGEVESSAAIPFKDLGLPRLPGRVGLDTFDPFHAPVDYRYVRAEVERCFAEVGAVANGARDHTGWFVLAHRV